MSLYELFELGAKKNSSKQAICFFNGDDSVFLSYSELAFSSHKISGALESRKLLSKVIVVVIPTGINLISTLLGILKSRNCFYYLSPLDLKAPKRFVALKNTIKFNYCLADSQEVVDELKRLVNGEVNVYQLEDTHLFIVEFTSVEIPRPDIAYVVTTSGSTGVPKTVYVPNKSIVPNIFDVVESFQQTADDVVFLSSPLTFDPSYVQMFTTFLTGSCLLVVEDALKLDSNRLLSCLTTLHKVTILQATPSLVSMFGEGIKNVLLSATSSLRILALGGEKCPGIKTLVRWKAEGNKTRIFNIYGITEVSCWATIHEISPKEFENLNDEVCLGRTMDKTLLELRNFNKETSEGELWIGGDERVCLLDEEDFEVDFTVMRPSGDIVRKDDQGMLYYIGRTDGMIKRMGKRMHLQELDKIVSNMEGVSYSASLWTEEALILFVVMCSNAKQLENRPAIYEDRMFASDAISFIKSWLPSHYLPNRILLLDQMPLNNHGKIDRKTLLKVYSDFIMLNESKYSDISSYFMELVSRYLGISPLTKIHLQKSWTQLGGNSILALSIYLELQKKFESVENLLLDKILNGMSIRNIADYLTPNQNYAGYTSLGNPRTDVVIKRSREHTSDLTERKLKRSKILEEKNVQSRNLIVVSRSLSYFSENLEGSSKTTRIKRIERVCNQSNQVKQELTFHECWRFDTGKCVDASPLIILGQEQEVFIGSHSHSFFALNLSLGTCNWETKLQDRIESSACLSKCASFIITGCYSGNIYILERSTGNIHWTFQAGNSIKSSPVIHPGTGFVYVGSHDGALYALDIQNKICQWRRNLNSGALFSSPCFSADGNKLYIGSLGGVLFCIDAGSGSVVWNINLKNPIFSSPASSGCHCFVGCVDGHLYAINTNSQQIAWTFRTNGPIFSSPNILLIQEEQSPHIELVIIGSHDRHVYCIETKSASMMWKSKLDSEIYGIPGFLPKVLQSSVFDEFQEVCAVLACSTKGIIYLLDISSGVRISTFNIGSEIFSSACAIGNKVLVGCRDNCLYCLEIK